MTAPPVSGLLQPVIAHQVGSAAFYWAIAAELLLPLWTAALLLAPRWGRSQIRARPFRIVGLATALAASLVTLGAKTLEIWPGNPLFPSGHTAYVVGIAVFLVGRDRRWLRWVVPLLALTAVSLVLSVFHVPIDIVGGAIVGLTLAVPLFRWLKRSESRRAVADTEATATACRQRAARTAATSRPTDGRSSGPLLR